MALMNDGRLQVECLIYVFLCVVGRTRRLSKITIPLFSVFSLSSYSCELGNQS